MKFSRLALALAALAAVLASAASAARAYDLRPAGTVETLSTTWLEVAYADEYRRGCHELRVWSIADHGNRRYASHCFPSTSTGSGIAAAVASHGRALWITYTGGNIREWSLWTKSSSSRARKLRFIPRDVDQAAPIVLGSSERHVLYAVGDTVVALAPDGARAFTVRAPAPVTAIGGSLGGYALQLEGGSVAIVSPLGKLVRTEPFAPGEVRAALVLAGNALLVQTATSIERRDKTPDVHPLPRNARFLGYAGGIVAYAYGAQLRLLRLRDDRTVTFRTLAPRFHAQLDRRGLGYGSGRVVAFNTWATVTGAFGA